MDERRVQACLALIQQLLACPSGQEPEILQANRELLEHEFVVLVLAVAAQASEAGEAQAAQFLVNLAEQVAQWLGGDPHPQPLSLGARGAGQAAGAGNAGAAILLQALLQAEAERLQSQGSPQMIFAILRQHLASLNLGLIPVMQTVVRDLIAEHPEEAEAIVALIENISIHISDFPLGNPGHNQQIAIAGYQLVLAVRTPANNPSGWAQTQNNLGSAYSDLAPLADNPKAALERAIACYDAALRVRTPAMRPVDCLQTGRNLGNLAFKAGLWQLALTGYEPAIAAVEQTRSWATDDQRRQQVLKDAIDVYNNALQCYINLEQYDQAILLTERARARHLVDLMASHDLYPDGNIPADVQRYLDEYETLQHRIDQLRQQEGDGTPDGLVSSTLRSTARLDNPPDQTQQRKAEIEALLAQKETVWAKLRARDRVLAEGLEVPIPQWANLTRLLEQRPRTALVSFYSTNDDTHILILRQSPPSPLGRGAGGEGQSPLSPFGRGAGGEGQSPLSPLGRGVGGEGFTCTVHTCPNQGYRTLQTWIRDQWHTPYHTDNDRWFQQMASTLQELAHRLDLDGLITNHLDGIDELILIPHIYLHLIPFAALPVGGGERTEDRGQRKEASLPSPALGEGPGVRVLGDLFRIRTLPSAQILSYCHDRENGPTAPTVPGVHFGTVEDATGDRPIVTTGFERTAQRLQIPAQNRLRGQTQATKANYRQLAQQPTTRALHSIHHAGSDLATPLNSALQLADGHITLGQLLSPGWRLPHLIEVFLACCETNLGAPNLTDDILTLASGFLVAGARAVVSTLWSVDAIATAIFCDWYYHYRQQGDDRPTALQHAQQALRTLPGSALHDPTQYQPLLNHYQHYLEATYSQILAKANAIHAQQQQAQQAGDTAKVQELDAKLRQYYQQAQQNRALREQYLPQLRQSPTPFADPHYWAAFVCHGLA